MPERNAVRSKRLEEIYEHEDKLGEVTDRQCNVATRIVAAPASIETLSLKLEIFRYWWDKERNSDEPATVDPPLNGGDAMDVAAGIRARHPNDDPPWGWRCRGDRQRSLALANRTRDEVARLFMNVLAQPQAATHSTLTTFRPSAGPMRVMFQHPCSHISGPRPQPATGSFGARRVRLILQELNQPPFRGLCHQSVISQPAQ